MSGPVARGHLDDVPRKSKNVTWAWGSWPPGVVGGRRYVKATPQELRRCWAYPATEAGRPVVRCRCGAGPWTSIVDYERHERGLGPLPPPVGPIEWTPYWSSTGV